MNEKWVLVYSRKASQLKMNAKSRWIVHQIKEKVINHMQHLEMTEEESVQLQQQGQTENSTKDPSEMGR